MVEVSTIGLDIAKNVFQVHGIDDESEVVVRRQLKRRQVLSFFGKLPACLVGMEACATSHHWARELEKLGHEVRLMPPRYVKPYVKRNSEAEMQTWTGPMFARRTMQPTRKRSAKRFSVRPCGSCRSRRLSSNLS